MQITIDQLYKANAGLLRLGSSQKLSAAVRFRLAKLLFTLGESGQNAQARSTEVFNKFRSQKGDGSFHIPEGHQKSYDAEMKPLLAEPIEVPLLKKFTLQEIEPADLTPSEMSGLLWMIEVPEE